MCAQEKTAWNVTEGDYVAKDFKFRSGESLAELKLHYRTLGTPARDAQGRVTNAVLILHGTGGTANSRHVNKMVGNTDFAIPGRKSA